MQQTGTIGIVGGGQLGRMLTDAALPLGFKVVVLNPEPGSPAAQAGAEEIVGGLYDATAITALAEKTDYLTVEIEHLNTEALTARSAQGQPVNPAPQTINLIQDKLSQKQFLRKNNVPVADFFEISDQASAAEAFEKFDNKMLLKSRHGAYDGRGNMLIESTDDIKQAFAFFKTNALYAEKFVPFKKELAIMVARDQKGNTAKYQVVETRHERSICVEVLVPAQIGASVREQAEQAALKVADKLEGAGVFGIEMFLTEDNQIIINEIAPRVHNSGHYTIEACLTSQFAQHIRAITGLPLGPTDMTVPAAVMINILGERDGPVELQGVEAAEADPHTKVHIYGKSPTKVDRKMGHITSVGDSIEEARKRAVKASKLISI